MKKRKPNKQKDRQGAVRRFQKSLVSYILMLIFFAFLFLRVGVPSFVFFIIAIPMTISIIHKYIDTYNSEDEESDYDEDIPEEEEIFDEQWKDESLDLEEFKKLRKEWKDSDFV